MRTRPILALLTVAAGVLVTWVGCSHRAAVPVIPFTTAATGAATVYTFDDLPTGPLPAAWSVGWPGPQGVKPARWEVVADGSGKALQQSDADDTNHRYPIALAPHPSVRDVTVKVRAMAVSGGMRDRSFGVVVRAKDSRTYYVARANTSGWGENVRFYKFIDGVRTELDEWECAVAAGQWHDLQVEARGSTFVVTLDGKAILRVTDAAIPDAGRVGVWTKAESVSRFDDLIVTPVLP